MLTRTPVMTGRIPTHAPAPRPIGEHRAPEMPHSEGELRLLRQKLSYLTNRGLWPQIELLARDHGWDSPELRQFIDKRIPTGRCPACGHDVVQFRSYTRFCSDSCRRSYRKQGSEDELLVSDTSSGMLKLA